MTKDAKEDKLGCVIIAALVVLMVSALAYAILSTGHRSPIQRHHPERIQTAPPDGSTAGGSAKSPAEKEI